MIRTVLGGAVLAAGLVGPVCAGCDKPPLDAESTPAPVSLRRLLPDVIHDQGRIWSFPIELARGQHVAPAAAFTVTTAALVMADPHDTPYFRRTQSFEGFNRVVSGTHSTVATLAVPSAFLVVGLARHDEHARQTSLRAFEALADILVLEGGLKAASGRLRPSDIDPHGDFTHTWFHLHGFNVGATSFPSGHTLAAFAVATVVSDQYRHKGWVKWVAFGAASVVGFSRVTLQSHFPSDVFAGAVLGYAMAHTVVDRR